MTQTPIELTPSFDKREERTQWVFRRFEHLFSEGKVLDVGCYEAPMRKLIGASRYTGVDFVGAPDIVLNLEQVETFPFEDGSFRSVMCIEVLEHLNNLHALARELFRLSSTQVLISLPNAWRDARLKIERGRGSIAHYGLPLEAPKDRHKWFFNADEARAFLEHIAPEGWSCRIVLTETRRSGLVRAYRRLRYSNEAYRNRYCQTVWAEYTKL